MHISATAIATARRIGTSVRERRAALQLDQSELALVAGVSRRTVHSIEHGKPTVQLAAIVAVTSAVGLDLDVLSRRNGTDS